MNTSPSIVPTYRRAVRRILTSIAAATLLYLILAPVAANAARVTRMNVPDATAHGAVDGVTVGQVRAAVLRAAADERWRAEVMIDGRVKAEYVTQQGKQRAVVTIKVEPETFLIRYLSSFQMGYRRNYCLHSAMGNQRTRRTGPCRNQGIHPYYNDWINELAYAIQDEVAAASPEPEGGDGSDEVADPMTERERFEIAERMQSLIARRDAGEMTEEDFEERKRALLLR